MRLSDLTNKHILILGYGKEGTAMEQALLTYLPNPKYAIIEKYPADEPILWDDYDIVIKSPGIPVDDELKTLGPKLTSSTQIFFDSIADKGATVIGITGSKGKSTTTSLIYEILKTAGKDVLLGGNIGKPMIDLIDDVKAGTIIVLEMSSYQLMDLTVSPQIAVITSFFPEHLDYHGTLEAYKQAKTSIAKYQKPADIIFYSSDFPEAKAIADVSPGTKVPFSASDSPVQIEETQLIGKHNQSNMAASFKVAQHLGVDPQVAIETIKQFKGLPHRLQRLGTFHEIEWVDDAISTTPESAIAALKALGNKVGTIILGGQDRGYDFAELGEAVANSQIGHVILFPGSGPKIKQSIMDAHRVGIEFHDAMDMKTAVEIAKKVTKPGKICLLSTASPSYNMFKNFEEKGELFQAAIRA